VEFSQKIVQDRRNSQNKQKIISHNQIKQFTRDILDNENAGIDFVNSGTFDTHA